MVEVFVAFETQMLHELACFAIFFYLDLSHIGHDV